MGRGRNGQTRLTWSLPQYSPQPSGNIAIVPYCLEESPFSVGTSEMEPLWLLFQGHLSIRPAAPNRGQLCSYNVAALSSLIGLEESILPGKWRAVLLGATSGSRSNTIQAVSWPSIDYSVPENILIVWYFQPCGRLGFW